MRIGAYQFDVRRGDFDHNLGEALAGLEAAARAELALLALPEMWPSSFPASSEEGPDLVEPSLRAVATLAARAAELDVVVVGSGFAPSPRPDESSRNRMHVLVGGRDVLGYDKVHLFSPTGEALAFSAGDTPPRVVSAGGVRVGGFVCYDLRFAPLLEALVEGGIELLVVPAQWPLPRIEHWRALLRGRAVEAQCFVLGANRLGTEPLGRRRSLEFPGASMVIAPDGEILSEGRGSAGLLAASIDPGSVARMRRAVPVERDRRNPLYESWKRQEEPPRGR